MPKKATKSKKATEVTPKALRVTKNDVTRPKAGGNTARVWEICDELTEKFGRPAVRGEVLAQVEKEKMPMATGATQYHLWRVFNGLAGRLQAPKIRAEKVKLPKPPKKASGKIGKQKKLPKPPAKKTSAPVAAPATEAAAPAAPASA